MFGEDFIARHDRRPQPLDLGLNIAVMSMAQRTNPYGWDIVDNFVSAPSSLSDLNRAVNSTGKLVVWGGGSDTSIYACPEHNAAFRAWHDSVHWRHQLPMNFAGEAATVYVQIKHLLTQYGLETETEDWAALLLCEVIGQNLTYIQTGEYPADQRAYTEANVDNWKRLARQVCSELEADDVNELQAIRLAQETWGKA
jgi:hypothetical protein